MTPKIIIKEDLKKYLIEEGFVFNRHMLYDSPIMYLPENNTSNLPDYIYGYPYYSYYTRGNLNEENSNIIISYVIYNNNHFTFYSYPKMSYLTIFDTHKLFTTTYSFTNLDDLTFEGRYTENDLNKFKEFWVKAKINFQKSLKDMKIKIQKLHEGLNNCYNIFHNECLPNFTSFGYKFFYVNNSQRFRQEFHKKIVIGDNLNLHIYIGIGCRKESDNSDNFKLFYQTGFRIEDDQDQILEKENYLIKSLLLKKYYNNDSEDIKTKNENFFK